MTGKKKPPTKEASSLVMFNAGYSAGGCRNLYCAAAY